MSTAVWSNPYGADDHKAQLAKLNRERVQRRRTEWQFIKSIEKNFDIKLLDDKRAELSAREAENANAPAPPPLSSRKIKGGNGNKHSGVPALPDVLEFSIFLPATGIRCLAVAHGGASLWTGEEDGSISIRNGATGQVAFTIVAPPPTANGSGAAPAQHAAGDIVCTLYSPEEGTQMWVGTQAGMVRVYDSRIFVRLHESTHPTSAGAVTSFVSSFNGRTFSAAGDSIIKWGTSEQKFAVLLELTHPTKVTAMRTHGYYLFVAGENDIVSYEGETGQGLKMFRGHTAPITCLQIQAGLLLSGSDDGCVRAWEIESAEDVACLILPERADAMAEATVAGGAAASNKQLLGIVDIIADQVTGQVWSVDRRGSIDIWSASSTGRFSFVRHIDGRVPLPDPNSGALPTPVRQVTGAVAVDTSKIWTLGSNGFNMVWHSTHNVMESQMAIAAVQMERELEETHKDMAQWREFIRTRQVVYENLGKVVAGQLAVINESIAAHGAFSTWLRSVDLSKRKTRTAATVALVQQESEVHVRWNAFQQWITLVRQRQAQRAKDLMVETARKESERNRLVGQARQLLWFARQLQHRARVKAFVEGAGRAAEHNICSVVYRKWSAFRVIKRTPYLKGDRASIVQGFNEKTLLRQRYLTWMAFLMRRRRAKSAALRASTVNFFSDNELRARAFNALRIIADKKARRTLLLKQVDAMADRNTAPLLHAKFTAWHRLWARNQEERYRKAMEDSVGELKGLRDKFKTIEHLHRRRLLLVHAEEMVKRAQDALDACRQAQVDSRKEIVDLTAELEAKRLGAKQDRERSIAEQVDDLIAMLKSKTLNLHQDFALSATIIKKWQTSNYEHPAAKMFLEAHQAVKRLVVTWTGVMHLGAEEEWPLTEQLIKDKLQTHEVATILDAIKTLVVSFDLMTPAGRSSLDTDKEIQINAKWIGFLADHCIELRAARLGAAANRVR